MKRDVLQICLEIDLHEAVPTGTGAMGLGAIFLRQTGQIEVKDDGIEPGENQRVFGSIELQKERDAEAPIANKYSMMISFCTKSRTRERTLGINVYLGTSDPIRTTT